MAKKPRVITASSELISIVDRGIDINCQIEGLESEADAIKSKLIASVEIGGDETSVKIQASTGSATVTRKTSLKFDLPETEAKTFAESFVKGDFKGAVKRKLTLTVPQTVTVEQVQAALKALKGDVEADYSATAMAVGELPQAVQQRLLRVAKEETSMAVKFEMNDPTLEK